MTKTFFASALLAVTILLAPTADASECRTNCIKIFQFCKQGCIDNYTGLTRRACKIGCRNGKRASIRQCGTYPQVCPPLE